MNREKVAAKVLGKIHAGKASVKDVGFLLNYFLESSYLYPVLKDDLPVVYLDMKNAGEVKGTVRGQYFGYSNAVFLNDKIIESARRGDRHSFVAIVTTYGHEMTHGSQWKHGEHFDYSLKEEDVKGMVEALGYTPGEHFCHNVAHGSYLRLKHEEGAREGGALFAQEVLKKMLNNPYLKEEDKRKLLEDIELAKQINSEEKEKNKYFYEEYESFERQFRDINISRLIDSEEKAADRFVDYANAVDLWIKLNDSLDVCKGYLKLIGKVDGSSLLRQQITRAINGEDFSREDREKMQGAIVRTFKENDLSIDYYERELADVLEEKQILELYEDALLRDMSKLDGNELFEEFTFSSEFAVAKGEILAKNYREGKIKVNNNEDFLSLAFEITKITFNGGKLLSEDLCEELEGIREAQFELAQSKKNVVRK